jgi:hypothetical protein
LEILYTLQPVISLVPTPFQDPKEAYQKWRELELVHALTEGKEKIVLVRQDRQLDLPLYYN